ncbi:MAG: response regulator transcription factor [Candidatus Polarisedimenticolaceae bacterium]|nr:response regulator transcription factor [Candidatus Polarisedimenticolaceae bacterium]
MRLLLVEDDVELANHLQAELARQGYAVDHVDNGIDAELKAELEPYDAVILDLGLPGRPGLEVLQNWRQKKNRVPVIILTARDAWHERVDGFKAGADDYLGKPFHSEELVARLQALIRRSHDMAGQNIHCGGLSLDEERQQVTLTDGQTLELTGTEFRLLRVFMLHPGRILSKTRLTEHVYDQDFDRDSNLIEVYVRRLRDKVGKQRIIPKRGQGYLFVERPE